MAFQAITSKASIAGKPVVSIQRGPRSLQSILPRRLVVEAANRGKAKAQVLRATSEARSVKVVTLVKVVTDKLWKPWMSRASRLQYQEFNRRTPMVFQSLSASQKRMSSSLAELRCSALLQLLSGKRVVHIWPPFYDDCFFFLERKEENNTGTPSSFDLFL